MKLQAVVFDWAGTVIDFGCQAPVAVLKKIFAARGVTLTDAEARAGMGLPKKVHVRHICSAGGYALDIDSLYGDFETVQLSLIAEHSAVIPGAVAAVNALRGMGLKIGSSTGYTRAMLDLAIPVAAAGGYVPDAAVTPEEAGGGRPYPWMCYVNAMRLGVYPMAAMVKVGDTPVDMEEGRNAGMLTIGVLDSSNEIGLTLAEFELLSAEDKTRLRSVARQRLETAGAQNVVENLGQLVGLLAGLA